jgi:hypothetical protein
MASRSDKVKELRELRRRVEESRRPKPEPDGKKKKRYRLSDILSRDDSAAALARRKEMSNFDDEMDEFTVRVLSAPVSSPRRYWGEVLHRRPTDEELGWLIRWGPTKSGNRMLTGYLSAEGSEPVSVRVIVWAIPNYQGEPGSKAFGVGLCIPADSNDFRPETRQLKFPNPAEAMLYVQRELFSGGMTYTKENPGRLSSALLDELRTTTAQVRYLENQLNQEVVVGARSLDVE